MEISNDHVTFQTPDKTWLVLRFADLCAISWDANHVYLWRKNVDKQFFVPRGSLHDNRLQELRLAWLKCKM